MFRQPFKKRGNSPLPQDAGSREIEQDNEPDSLSLKSLSSIEQEWKTKIREMLLEMIDLSLIDNLGKDQAAERVHQVNAAAQIGADPIEKGISGLICGKHGGEGKADVTFEDGKVRQPITSHFIAQTDQQGEEQSEEKQDGGANTAHVAEASTRKKTPRD